MKENKYIEIKCTNSNICNIIEGEMGARGIIDCHIVADKYIMCCFLDSSILKKNSMTVSHWYYYEHYRGKKGTKLSLWGYCPSDKLLYP